MIARLPLACLSLALLSAVGRGADDLALREQRAFDRAIAAVSDAVVQIRTVGGLDQVEGQSLPQGPTTGLIVTQDGYIVSSAVNFVQRPSSVLVRLPNGRQRPARLIGRDTGRMLVLLKVDGEDALPTPQAAPLSEVRVGDWAIAAGRTYDAERVNVSVGVISALGRMHGRVVQTDASASAANYGGPLVDLRGRVIGVLTPMAPSSPGGTDASELAGTEFYDSGIAFAVPLEHILQVLPRWMADGDLQRGLLGVGMVDGNPHAVPPKLTAVWPRSPAALAGWQKGDVIIAVDGRPVESQTQLRRQIAPRYAGDTLRFTLRRGEGGDAEQFDTETALSGELPPFRPAMLGVLPTRPTETGGVTVREVWPGSPAAEAGIQRGDRLTAIGESEIGTLDAAVALLNAQAPGDQIVLKYVRGDEQRTASAPLAELTAAPWAFDEPPASATEPSGTADGGEDLVELRIPEFSSVARCVDPGNEGYPPAVLIWLGEASASAQQRQAAVWREACLRDRVVLVLPTPTGKQGWSADDVEYLTRLTAAALSRFGGDARRVVIAGAGKAGQVAYLAGFKARRWVRGIATIDSPLPRTLTLPTNSPNQRLVVLSLQTPDQPLTALVRRDLARVADAGFAVAQAERRGTVGPAGIGPEIRDALCAW
ncbi:MAG TPA: PDZ domain-containing protein, partial [Lacipirellulaceae bacterium]|nr:PDZ domain-containing protein [Lacipirellulaceae bacterium]